MGFRVWGSEFRGLGLGLEVWGLVFRVQGQPVDRCVGGPGILKGEFRVHGLGFRVSGVE